MYKRLELFAIPVLLLAILAAGWRGRRRCGACRQRGSEHESHLPGSERPATDGAAPRHCQRENQTHARGGAGGPSFTVTATQSGDVDVIVK